MTARQLKRVDFHLDAAARRIRSLQSVVENTEQDAIVKALEEIRLAVHCAAHDFEWEVLREGTP